MDAAAIALVAAGLVAWALASSRLARDDITSAMAFVAFGLVVHLSGLVEIDLESTPVEVVAEVALAMLLFSDAARVNRSRLGSDAGLPLRLLLIGLPLAVLAGWLAGRALFGDLEPWGALLLAACLAPTDAGLGAVIVTDERVPGRIRRLLNVESGLNDGLMAPLVGLGVAVVAGEQAAATDVLSEALGELVIGSLLGGVVGAVVGVGLVAARRRDWMEPGAVPVAGLGAAVLAYASAVALGGNGFVAAFVAGIAFGNARGLPAVALEMPERGGQVLASVVWFVFGAAMLPLAWGDLTWQVAVFAVASLTAVRMVPVALALVRSHLDTRTVLFVGWFGPRGLASLVFALIAVDSLGGPVGTTVLSVVSITVAISVVAHGVSSRVLAGRFGDHCDRAGPDHATRRDVEPMPSRRLLHGSGPHGD
jgi:NhaP-type Na+/H+ or K+/H+ antiporter